MDAMLNVTITPQIFANRLKICQEGSQGEGNSVAWQLLYHMVDKLGVSGNSSDESEGDNYAIRRKEWRSTEVQYLLVYIDANRKTTNEFGSNLPGTRPHTRFRRRNANASIHRPVAGLPRNFYNNAWYDSLTEIQQFHLDPSDPVVLPDVE